MLQTCQIYHIRHCVLKINCCFRQVYPTLETREVEIQLTEDIQTYEHVWEMGILIGKLENYGEISEFAIVS